MYIYTFFNLLAFVHLTASIRKVPANDRDATQTRHLTPLKNRLFLFQDLMSEVIPGLVPTRVREDNNLSL